MPTRRPKLLLADDSPTTRKVVSLTFADEGLEVVAVGDGGQALRHLEEGEPPDVVLADVWMPAPGGYELCERIKRDGRLRHVPVILLVGTFEPFDEAEARRVGADEVLTKPFHSIRELVSKVGTLLGGGGPGREEAEPPAQQAGRPPSPPPPDARAQPASAPQGEVAGRAPGFSADAYDARGEDEEERPRESASTFDQTTPFANSDYDDELIEERPAGTFLGAVEEARDARLNYQEMTFEEEEMNELREAGDTNEAEPGRLFLTREKSGDFDEPARFAASSFGPPAYYDELLDLDGPDTLPHDATSGTSAGALSAGADDSILDLGEDFAPPLAASYSGDPSAPESFDVMEGHEPGASHLDAAGAFAEAAHGETVQAAPAEFSLDLAGTEEAYEQVPAEIVMQDEPQAAEESDYARDEDDLHVSDVFVEPTVEPAAEPVPGTVESEYTDGSVEGDVPKPPLEASGVTVESEEGDSVESAVVRGWESPEPPAAAHVVGATQSGYNESAGTRTLSPEDVDAIARRVVELMSDSVVREIAWEVVPDLAELLIKRRLDESDR